jgi:DNA adenine methylase
MKRMTEQLDLPLMDLDKTNQKITEKEFVIRKEALLKKLLSTTGKTKYKRHTVSPLRYAGGKSLAVGLVAELLPNDVKKVMSPFFGGGSIEIALAKDLGLEVQGYDIFDILVNYWQYQISDPKKLALRLAKFEPTREKYLEIRDVLKKHWKGEKVIKNSLDLAAIYYFNHNCSYGPHFIGHPSMVYLNDKRYETTLKRVREFDAGSLAVDCLTFDKSIPKHKNDFIYADPPYYLDGDSKTFVGMYPHRNFPIHHKGFDHELLRDLLKKHKGRFILSYNDCSTIREWYKEFEMYAPKWQYTFSQGDTRIGENRLRDNEGSHIKQSHELIIWNY